MLETVQDIMSQYESYHRQTDRQTDGENKSIGIFL